MRAGIEGLFRLTALGSLAGKELFDLGAGERCLDDSMAGLTWSDHSGYSTYSRKLVTASDVVMLRVDSG